MRRNPSRSPRYMSDFAALYPTYVSGTIAKPCRSARAKRKPTLSVDGPGNGSVAMQTKKTLKPARPAMNPPTQRLRPFADLAHKRLVVTLVRQILHLKRHAMIVGERVAVAIEKIPVNRRNRQASSPVALR